MALKTVKKSNKDTPSINIQEILDEYNNLGEKAKIIKERREELAAKIKQYALDNGVKNDKGSYYIDSENYVYGCQAKKGISLNREKAEKFFKAKKLWGRVVDIVETINESKVETLVKDGEVSIAELELLTDTKITYAVDVKKKEKVETMPEVQEVKTKSSVRKPLSKRK